MFVASSSSGEIIEAVMKRLNIRAYFDGIVSGDDVKNSKPAPDIFLKASELAGVKPAYCVVIEDSPNGVKAARAAGMKVVGLNADGSDKTGFDGADSIITSLGDFMGILHLLDFKGN